MKERPLCACGCGNLVNHNGRKHGFYTYLQNHNKRIKPRIRLSLETGCWIALGKLRPEGYMYITRCTWGKPYTRALHRVFYEMAYGSIPKDLQLDHKCRNRACCNPQHLEAVTIRENIRRGKNAKLTHQQVSQIKFRLARGDTSRRIARDFGIVCSAVYHIKKGRTWSDIPSASSLVQ